MASSNLVRKDRDKLFREKILARFNYECCFIPTMVPTWNEYSKLNDTEKIIKCSNNIHDSKLMIYRKDGNINNNSDDNILLLCKYHYGVMFNELRTKIKNAENKRLGKRKEKRKFSVITMEDFRKLLGYVQNPEHLMLLQTLYYIGGRINEIVSTTKEDVILNRAIPSIRFKAENTKRKVERFVPIPNNMVDPFKIYIKNKENSDRLFDFSPQRAWQIVKFYIKKAGLNQDIHPHSFRHSYATEIYNKTGDLKVVQDLLGHKNLATTSIYAHTSESHKKNVVNDVFGKK